MKNATELLMRIIANENKHIESMRHTLKEDELTVLRLQNKTRILEIEIEERKQFVEEYRSYLKDISEVTDTRMKLVPSTTLKIDTESLTTKVMQVTV